jgi:lysophospholipase L1-like esterase
MNGSVISRGIAGGRLLRGLSFLLLLVLLFVSVVPLGAVTQKKKSTHSAQSKSSKSKSKKKSHGNWRRRIHWLPGPRFNAAKRTQLVQEMNDELTDAHSGSLEYEKSLNNFFAALLNRASGEASQDGSQTVRVLQFGDSHTAADVFTGEARRLLQEKFGNGSIGFAYAGHPFAGYRVFGASHSATDGWATSGNHFMDLGDARTGLGGLSITTDRANESVTLDSPCTSLELEYLVQPGGGSIQFTDNGTLVTEIDTDGQSYEPGSFNYQCPVGDHHFAVITESNQPVTLLGWIATKPGVTWECLGINGAEAPLILKWDQALFSSYLKSNDPALIVLAYGTNEAASSTWDETNYAQRFAQIVDTLHSYVPDASILVIGPADRATVVHHSWRPYGGTDKIIAAQKAVCARHNCAYWDQRERMGGFGSMMDWAGIGWAQGDHTHFTSEGYRELADAFMLDLMSSYKEYKEHVGAKLESAGTDTVQGKNEDREDGRKRKNTEGAQRGFR